MLEDIWNYVIHVPVEVAKMVVIPVCMWSSIFIWVIGQLKDRIPIFRREFHLFVGYFPDVFDDLIPIACSMLALCWHMVFLPHFFLVMAVAFVYFLVILLSGQAVSANSSPYYTKAFSLIFVVLILSTSPQYVVVLYISGLFIYVIRKETSVATEETQSKPPNDHICRTNDDLSHEKKTDNLPENNSSFTISPKFESVETAVAAGIITEGVGNKFDMKNNNISGNVDRNGFVDAYMPGGRARRRGEEDESQNYDSKNTAEMTGQVTAQRIEGNVLTTTEVTGNTISTNVKDSTIEGSLFEGLKGNDNDDEKGSGQGINIQMNNVGMKRNEEEENEMKKLIETANSTVSELKSEIGTMITDKMELTSGIQELCLRIRDMGSKVEEEMTTMNAMMRRMSVEQNGVNEELQSKIGSMMADNKRCISNTQEMCNGMEAMVENKLADMKDMVGQMRSEQNDVKEELQSKIGSMMADNKRCISNTQEMCNGMEAMVENKLADMKDMVGQMRSEQNDVKEEMQSKIGSMMADNKRCISNTQEMCHGMEAMVENKFENMKEMVGQLRTEQTGVKEELQSKIGSMMADNKRCISNTQEMCHGMEVMVENKFENMKDMVGQMKSEKTGVNEELQSKIGSMMADNERCISNTQEMCHGMEVMVENKLANLKDMVSQIGTQQNGVKEEVKAMSCDMNIVKRQLNSLHSTQKGLDTVMEKLSLLDDISDKVLKLPHLQKDLERINEEVAEKLKEIRALSGELTKGSGNCCCHWSNCPRH